MKKYSIYEMREQVVYKEQLEKGCCDGGNGEFIKSFKTLAEAMKEVDEESRVIAQRGNNGTYYDVTEYVINEEEYEMEDGEEVFIQGMEVFRSEMPAEY